MSDLHDLIRACKAEPDDDAPRLILADWLEEHGEAERAALIRSQVNSQDVTVDAQHTARFAGPWGALQDEIRNSRSDGAGLYAAEFMRGFLRVRDGYRELYDRLDRILAPPFDWTWLEEIKFGSWHDGDWTPFFQSDRLLELNRLEFIDDGYRSVLLEPLPTSPYVASLRHLHLMFVRMDDDGLARLSQCPRLAGLRSLEFTEMWFGPAGVRAFATSELWDQLISCKVAGSRIGNEGLAEMATGRPRPRLERLDLAIGEYTDDGLVELAKSDRFPNLTELGIGYRNTSDEEPKFGHPGVEALLLSPGFRQAKFTIRSITYTPIPEDLGSLQLANPHRLTITYKNPRQSRNFQTWAPE